MTRFTQEELQPLLNQETAPCVSVYMPMHRAGAETRQNAIRYKNLLGQARQQLLEAWPADTVAQVLTPADELQQDQGFFQQQSDGLALFMAPQQFIFHRLPLHFSEQVVVADHFHIKPLLPALDDNMMFYVLALSMQAVQLYECTREHINLVPLPEDMPRSLDEALRFDQTEDRLHLQDESGTGMSPAFHGHGSDPNDLSRRKTDILRFFHHIAPHIRATLRDSNAPMILAGVEYLLPLYRQANEYPHLHESVELHGNFEERVQDLHAQGVQQMSPIFEQAHIQAKDAFYAADNGSVELKDVLAAAHMARIEILWVAQDSQRWGRYDPQTQTTHLHPQRAAGDAELLNLAAMQTLKHGGEVHSLPSDQLPGTALLAAIYRF